VERSLNQAQLSDNHTRLVIPRPTVITLCGPSGSGKSTFAARNFPANWVLSSDKFRGLVCDDERNQDSSKDAFDLLYWILDARLRYGRTTIVDSTALTVQVRRELLQIVHRHDFAILLLLIDAPEKLCRERDAARIDPPPVGAKVVEKQFKLYQEVENNAQKEGFDQIIKLNQHEITNLQVEIVPLSLEKPEQCGPFDLIGDIHGCYDELCELLKKLGYQEENGIYRHPLGRRTVFLGDIVNRGPKNLEVLRLVNAMVKTDNALFIPGNHCYANYRYFQRPESVDSNSTRNWIERLGTKEYLEVGELINALVKNAPPYLLLNQNKLVVAHAGIEEHMIGKLTPRIFNFCLNGEILITPDGNKQRKNWAENYRGKPLVVYGHTPTTKLFPEFRNNTVNLDQGCVYGGRLSAMRYPEMEFIQVNVHAAYAERKKRGA